MFPDILIFSKHSFLLPLQTSPKASMDVAEETMKEMREEAVEEVDEGKVSGSPDFQ